MIEVTHSEDGSYEISWDENDPVESQLNNWTEEDFLTAIRERCLGILSEGEGG